MRVELFDYHLPAELIAQRPAEPRDSSRLMVVDCQTRRVDHRLFQDLPDYLQEGDCLVFNDSRVRRARLLGRKKEGGAGVEVLLLRHQEGAIWEALARPARRMRPGTEMVFAGAELEARVVEKGERGRVFIRLVPGDQEAVEEILERIGEIPLPPYIKERLEDPDRYQTVFAGRVGSAAAPTAGLHFDERLLRHLAERGMRLAFIRLDVGLDTFKPIEQSEVERHPVYTEDIALDEQACATINAARREGHRVVAVGTTVVRALESAVRGGEVAPFNGATELFIYPGFRFQAVDCLLTNFHLPRSSPLLLVCAFAGRDVVMEAYTQAVERQYRFLSFGDACFFQAPHACGIG